MTGIGLFAICYLFLGGVGAGTCTIASLFALLTPKEACTAMAESISGRNKRCVLAASYEHRRLISPLFALSFSCMALGSFFLIADLGVADRILALFFSGRVTYLTVGAYSLTTCMILTLLLTTAWCPATTKWRFSVVQVLHVLAFGTSFVVAVYTGLLLSSMQSVPFWHSAWLPALFTASALSCGCAITVATACLTGASNYFGTVLTNVMKLDIGAIILELVFLVGLFTNAYFSSYEVLSQSVCDLLMGEYAPGFLTAVCGCGLAVPLVAETSLLFLQKHSEVFMLVVAAAVCVGGYALRYYVVIAGLHVPVWL